MSVPAEYISILEKLVERFTVKDEDLITDIPLLKKGSDENVPDKVFTNLLARLYLIAREPSLSFEFGKLIGSDAHCSFRLFHKSFQKPRTINAIRIKIYGCHI